MHLVTLTATMRRIYDDAAESSVADLLVVAFLGSGGEEEEEDFIAVVVKWSSDAVLAVSLAALRSLLIQR